MFAIIISEKGGAERRESFDKNEINVGRVQGNDLMLPKGNVSKHHARLLFRDGRFIVTDLKSTNGTYVNGRKIAQATIVREGDKIYIGDFVIRLETNGAPGQSVPPPNGDANATGASPTGAPANNEDEIRTGGRDPIPMPPMPPIPQASPAPVITAPPVMSGPMGGSAAPTGPKPLPNSPAVTLKAPTHPPGALPLPRPQGGNVSNVSNAPAPMQSSSPAYPLDQDPDDSAAPMQKPPARNSGPPPAMPSASSGGMRPMTMPLNQMSPPAIGGLGGRPLTPGGLPPLGGGSSSPQPTPPAAIAQAPIPVPVIQPPPIMAPPPLAPPPLAPPPVAKEPPPPPPEKPSAPSTPPSMPPGRATAPPPRIPPKETPAQAGRRLALMTLLDRIGGAVDLSPLRTNPIVSEPLAQQIERAAKDQANGMRDEGEAPEGIDLDAVARDAHRELVGLGAFGPLLDDEEVAEIHAVRFDQVFSLRNGNTNAVSEPTGFSSEEALSRIVARLAMQAGAPWKPGEVVIERRLQRAAIVAIAPPAAASLVVSIRKRRRIETTLEELAKTGSASKGMGQFLEACIAARANILVSGNAPLPLLSALATASGNSGERVVVVQDVEEIGVGNANVATISIGEASLRAASKLRADRLVVTQLAGGVAAATIDAMADGNDGILAALSAPTLRQGMSRIVAQLVLHRPGLTLEGMREVIGESFDIAVEVGSFPDGRLRVMRIAELGGADAKGIVTRDLFVFNADPGGGDGNFSATGVVPRIANELAARGMKLDAGMFKRANR